MGSWILIEVMKTAMMIARTCLETKEGEEVLIAGDYQSDFVVIQTLAAAVRSCGAEPTITLMTPREKSGQAPTRIVERALDGAQAGLFPATTSLTHTESVQRALREKRIRFLSMPAVTAEMLTQGAATADYAEVYQIGKALSERLKQADQIRITSPQGTDLTASLKGMPCKVGASIAREPGTFSTFPGGEAYQGPREGTAEGKVVIDTSIHMLGLLEEPIIYRVEKGRVKAIEGGPQAVRLRELLQGVENWDNIAEISIGTNRKARITGNVSEDKKGLGRVHVALGDNRIYGGTVASNIHVDGVIARPTVEVDGEILVRDGKVILPEWGREA